MSRWAAMLQQAKVAPKQEAVAPVALDTLPINSIVWVGDAKQYAEQITLMEQELQRVLLKTQIKFKPVRIILSHSMRSNAGTAFWNKREVHLHIRLLVANPAELLPTFIHEMCHIWTHDHYGSFASAHGNEWRNMMWSCGHEPERVHFMDTSEFKRNRESYRYYCGCGADHTVGPKVHKKLQAGWPYTCAKCKGKLHAAPQPIREQKRASPFPFSVRGAK